MKVSLKQLAQYLQAKSEETGDIMLSTAAAIVLEHRKLCIHQQAGDTTDNWREAIPKMAPAMVEHAGFPGITEAENALWLFILMVQGGVEGMGPEQVERGRKLLKKYFMASVMMDLVDNDPIRYLPANVTFDNELMSKAYSSLLDYERRFSDNDPVN